jgi:hypothetical protein
LREEFAQMVERITERFTQDGSEKPKVFRNATVESFYEYFETFKERNIFQDQDLAAMVNQAQAILSSRSADQIRSNESMKEEIRAGMTDIENAMTTLFNRPKRKIIMD